MEDNAAPHKSKYQIEVFSAYEVTKLLWPGNSPDLKPTEPTWFWMKCETTKKGAIHNEKHLKAAWIKCWKELPQERIQAWIERVPIYIQEVIRLQGGNEYQEGRLKGQVRDRLYL